MGFLEFLQNINSEFYVFVCSMIPVIELRGAIPIGAGLQMNMFETFFIAVIGNMLPIPFILVFIKKILEWMSVSKVKLFRKISNWLNEKAEKRSDKVTKYSTLGLLIFVAIPLPGTGAWTGALIAALMEMRFKKAFFSILGGVIIAGAIMTAISYGFLQMLSFLA